MNQLASLAARLPAAGRIPAGGRIFLALLERLKVGSLTLHLPGGEVLRYGSHGGDAAELRLADWRACSAILRSGDIGFAESYRQGWLDSPDLTALIGLALRNEAVLTSAFGGSWPGKLWYALLHRLRRNTRAGSRRNIHAHYDLGNAFYALWLDPSWTYSSALFGDDPAQSLQSAQAAKYQRIVDVLGLRPGMRVLEIGCGWGGFAIHAARRGIQVHGITISQAQWELAQRHVAAAGCGALANLELRDYRDLDGRYDAVVSIEMFEAVGESYWARYFDTVRQRLEPGGRALIQTITIDDARFAGYRASSDFIREYIFPGGMLPSPAVFAERAAGQGLSVLDRHAFGRDYAETLRRWRARFEGRLDAVREQGFDEAFIRIWRLYFQYCEAGFDMGSIDVYQFMLQREA
ncbi:SAM-dependent methyltransferase [Chitinimonas koreensis]|uniref:SAM-dependent methyltransferase n=1 Tax=Chitinimonas koreensis TaxID=356302 RepID=UPI0003FD9825|nr:cyclopropane-fatty-acyl-phospholipid synthase family protein [Chitinimonas koreensis]QNM95319.1 class I SAM-dependent methyltransferase [Chitinimonas koreensis]